ncbi:MAG: hypothetical protein KDC11_04670, partial [Chitinophagaceae bacterium]|nr:hypothetical protein [Chitinophagaceae bacterium]
ANEKISYMCFFPAINPQKSPQLGLREGEGKSQKYVLEGSMYEQIPVMIGRNHSSHFFQTTRITADFGMNIRMTKDSSNPLVPNNNIMGVSVNKILWNSYTSKNRKSEKDNDFSFQDWYALEQPLQLVSLRVTAHHYSNGQQLGFYHTGTVNGVPLQRNDYKGGDFSTNYIQAAVTYSYLTKKRSVASVNVGYQWDGSFGGPFKFSDEQINCYGQHRIIGFAQYKWLFRRSKIKEDAKPRVAYSTCEKKKVDIHVKKYSELTFRWEPEYIMGNMSRYSAPDGKLHRFNNHFYLQYTQGNWRALGFLLHCYTGRDYANIRYDLPITAVMLGVSLNFNKYYPALSNKMRYCNPAKENCTGK